MKNDTQKAAPVAAHTPGTWIAEATEDDRYDRDSIGRHVFEITSHPDLNDGYNVAICYGPDREANARLIASAPQLLDALVQFRDAYLAVDHRMRVEAAFASACAAVAAAEKGASW